MRHLMMVLAWLWVALMLDLGAGVLRADAAENPYSRIAARNVFALSPLQPQPTEPPPAPLAMVKLVGITTLCGRCALLKVHLPAQPPEPAREVACILKVGQRDGPIELLEIDEQKGRVRVRNSGTETMLMLERETVQPPRLPAPPRPPLPLLKVTLPR
jgi:hypothetical protein